VQTKTLDILGAAVGAENYRDFLSAMFSVLGQHSRDGRFNHSMFARKAGLKSRGFAQEVVSGRKRLTAQSYPKFEKALGLPPRVTALFRLLVLRDEPSMNEEELTVKEIASRIESARARLQSDLDSSGSETHISRQVFRHRHVLTVYATLGNQKKGVTFEDIVRRTGLQPALVRRVLGHLVESDVAVEKASRFRSINPHLVFKGLGGDHPVKDAYLDTLSELQKSAAENFSDADKTFIHSHVSLDPRRLGELKKRLWDVVLEFIDECDDDDGEVVAKLLVGFYV
jgi:DNA-binding transcriptional ArsR family regulator